MGIAVLSAKRPAGRTLTTTPRLELLARQAVVHARAGADMVAPSGMMDGMVGAIRRGSTPPASRTCRL